MEQYWMPKELDFENLRLCLDNHIPEFLYIRLIGSRGGIVKVNENLENKIFDFRKNKSGLHLFVNSEEVFHFPLRDYEKGFSLAYERFFEDGKLYTPRGMSEEPYDSKLPEPKRSFLRTGLDDHLMEIFFKGRVDVKFHSWWDEELGWKYWTIEKPNNI